MVEVELDFLTAMTRAVTAKEIFKIFYMKQHTSKTIDAESMLWE